MTEAPTGLEVEHDSARTRFVVRSEGREAALEYQELSDKIVFTHTGVPGVLEGRGIGAALAREGLEWARASGKRVIPLCPFVASFIGRHPEYAELIRRGGAE